MVYLETGKITIGQLIKVLQKAKADLPNGDKTRVLLATGGSWVRLNAVSAQYVEPWKGDFFWSGDYPETGDIGDEVVLTLSSFK